MGVDVVDRPGLHPRVIERDCRRPGGLATVGPRLDHMVRIGGRAVAEELGVRDGAAALGHLRGLLEDEQRRAFAHDEAVAVDVERPRRGDRVVVVTGRSARMMSNAPNARGLNGTSTPPAIAASTRPSRRSPSASPRATAPDAHELAVDRIGPRTSRAIPRLAGAAPPKTAEREVGRDLPDPRLQVALVLFLGVGDAAERRSEVDPDPFRGGRPVGTRGHPRVVQRQPASHQPELAEPVELAGGLRRHPGERIEVVDLGGDLRAERARVEAVDPLHWRNPALRTPGPERLRSVTIGVTSPIPVIHTRRRSLMTTDLSAKPSDLTGRRGSTGRPRRRHGFRDRAEGRECPGRDRPGEPPVDEGRL